MSSYFEQDLCFVHVYLDLCPAHRRLPLFTDCRYAWLEPFRRRTGAGTHGVSRSADLIPLYFDPSCHMRDFPLALDRTERRKETAVDQTMIPRVGTIHDYT